MFKNNKNSDHPESNQGPKDNHATLQSSALPAELWSVMHFTNPSPRNREFILPITYPMVELWGIQGMGFNKYVCWWYYGQDRPYLC